MIPASIRASATNAGHGGGHRVAINMNAAPDGNDIFEVTADGAKNMAQIIQDVLATFVANVGTCTFDPDEVGDRLYLTVPENGKKVRVIIGVHVDCDVGE